MANTPYASQEANVAGALVNKNLTPNLRTLIDTKYGNTPYRLERAYKERTAMSPAEIMKTPVRPQRRKAILEKSIDGALRPNGTKDRTAMPEAQKRYEHAEAFGALADEIVTKGYKSLTGDIEVPDGSGGWVVKNRQAYVKEQATAICLALPDVAEMFRTVPPAPAAEIQLAIEEAVCNDPSFAKNIYKAYEKVAREGRVVSSEKRDRAKEEYEKAKREENTAQTNVNNIKNELTDDMSKRPPVFGLRSKMAEFDPPAAKKPLAPGAQGPGVKLTELTDLKASQPARTASLKIYAAEEDRIIKETGRVSVLLNRAQQDLDSDTAAKGGTPDPTKEAEVRRLEAERKALETQLVDVVTKKEPFMQAEARLGELSNEETKLREKLTQKETDFANADREFREKQIVTLSKQATLAQEEMDYTNEQNALVEEFQQVFGEGAGDTLIQKLESIDAIRQEELQNELAKLKNEDQRSALRAVEAIGMGTNGRIDRKTVQDCVADLSKGTPPEQMYMAGTRRHMIDTATRTWQRENPTLGITPEVQADIAARVDRTLADRTLIQNLNEQFVKSLMQKSFKTQRLNRATFASLASSPDIGVDRMRAALEANNDFMDFLRETKQEGLLKDTGPAHWAKTLSSAGLWLLIMALFGSKSAFNGF